MLSKSELNQAVRSQLGELGDGRFLVLAARKARMVVFGKYEYDNWLWNIKCGGKKRKEWLGPFLLVQIGEDDKVMDLFLLPNSTARKRKTVAIRRKAGDNSKPHGWLTKYRVSMDRD